MKSRINLYSSAYAPTLNLVSLNNVVLLFVFLVVLFSVVTAVTTWKANSAQADVERMRGQLSALKASVDASQKALLNRKPNQELIAKIDKLKIALEQKQGVLVELANRESAKNTQFSKVLRDLADADSSEVWLTYIDIQTNTVILEGYGIKADSMPNWLSQLSGTESFTGVDFQHVTLEKQDKGIFFSLRTATPSNAERSEGR
ncbi:PilN domain-containing protein [Alteromonas sp. 5E99-2]|uniref:PilN domain-containing protein n=1 Tax=Alteromonas sp. 5E99-2 TaxID=2817683 RepID=UPI001A994718|nr:PilN domain-containing protein [Alteromonas sp. 5E99-2]MBO1255852.1 PilN domain-containing protein [Alteromonas sp. 5E99-2]